MSFRNIAGRLSYANVVATVALFLALGGVSYAVMAVPANSVGTRQLSFPIGAASRTADFTQRLIAQRCNPFVPCPPPEPQMLRSVSFTLKRPGRVLVLGAADVVGDPSPAAVAQVRLSAELGGDQVGLASGSVGSSSSKLAFWQVVSVAAGRHVVHLGASAQVDGARSTTLSVNSAQLDVIALPALG